MTILRNGISEYEESFRVQRPKTLFLIRGGPAFHCKDLFTGLCSNFFFLFSYFEAGDLSSFSKEAATNTTKILEDITYEKEATLSARQYVTCKFLVLFHLPVEQQVC